MFVQGTLQAALANNGILCGPLEVYIRIRAYIRTGMNFAHFLRAAEDSA